MHARRVLVVGQRLLGEVGDVELVVVDVGVGIVGEHAHARQPQLARLVDIERGELGGIERQLDAHQIVFRIGRLAAIDLVVDLLHPLLQPRPPVVERGHGRARPLEQPVGARDVVGDVGAILVHLRARRLDAGLGRAARRLDLAEGVQRLHERDPEVEGHAMERQDVVVRAQVDDVGAHAVVLRTLTVARGHLVVPRLAGHRIDATDLG